MKNFKLTNSEVQQALSGQEITYPKYTTQLMNLANQNSQGTRPRVVGQLSDLIQEFEGHSLIEWECWYKKRHPDAIKNATERILPMVEALKESIISIDRVMIEKWVEELLLIKTFSGLKFQSAILKAISEKENKSYRLADKSEESQGVDGCIGGIPVSIKPSTYKIERRLNETIEVPIIYYEKKKTGIVIEYDINF